MFISEIVHTEDSFLLKLYYKFNFATEPSVLYLAIFPTIIPYVLLAYIVKSVGVSDATMSLYLTPIVSLLLSYLLLDELPTTLAIIGGIITLLGVSLSNFFQNT
ncbi:TPA: EamA family transporter [Staphylococcus aureus]